MESPVLNAKRLCLTRELIQNELIVLGYLFHTDKIIAAGGLPPAWLPLPLLLKPLLKFDHSSYDLLICLSPGGIIELLV